VKPGDVQILFVSRDRSRSFGIVKLNDRDWFGGELDASGRPIAFQGKPTDTRKQAIAEAVARASAAGIDTRRPGESDHE